MFNIAQAGGKSAEQHMAKLNFELQKLDFDEAGVEPGKEQEYIDAK